MDGERMHSVIEAFIAAMNAHDEEALAACCTDDVVADEVAEPDIFDGIEAVKDAYRDVFTGYPDSEAHVLSRHADGDTLIYQVRWSGTNSGSFRGGPPTGKPVDLRIAYFFRFREEKIERITEYYDLATLLAQQGQLEA